MKNVYENKALSNCKVCSWCLTLLLVFFSPQRDYLEDFFFALLDNHNIYIISFLFCVSIVRGKRTLTVMFLFYFMICYWLTQYIGAETLQISYLVDFPLCEVCFLPSTTPNFHSHTFRLASCGPEGSVSELSVSFYLVSQLSNHDKGQIILLETWCNLAHSCLTSFLRGKEKKNTSTL